MGDHRANDHYPRDDVKRWRHANKHPYYLVWTGTTVIGFSDEFDGESGPDQDDAENDATK